MCISRGLARCKCSDPLCFDFGSIAVIAPVLRQSWQRKSFGAFAGVDKDLDRQRLIDHIAAKIWIVTIRLGALVCSPGTRQQRMAARPCRRDPIVLPTAPGVAVDRVEEVALYPGCTAIQADPDFADIGAARPGGAENGVGAIGF